MLYYGEKQKSNFTSPVDAKCPKLRHILERERERGLTTQT
jgi:hypothetical protein